MHKDVKGKFLSITLYQFIESLLCLKKAILVLILVAVN